jgi:hypothetical protein
MFRALFSILVLTVVGLARAVIFTDSGNGCFCATAKSANSTGAAFANATVGCRDWNGASK